MRFLFALAGLVFMASPLLAATKDIPVPANEGRVTDKANLFSPEQKENIAKRLKELETTRTDSPQVVLLTISPIPDNDILTFAVAVVEKWKIGQKNIDNGVLIVINPDPSQKEVRFEVGYGLEPVLPDTKAFQIIKEAMGPKVRGPTPDWYGATMAAITDIGAALETKPVKAVSTASSGKIYVLFLVLAVIATFGIALIFMSSNQRRLVFDVILAILDAFGRGGGGGGGGGSSGGGSSNSWGGGGGGRSGGGGASARL